MTTLALLLAVGGTAIHSTSEQSSSQTANAVESATLSDFTRSSVTNAVITPASMVTIPTATRKISVAKYKTTIHLMLRSGAGTNHKIIGSGKKGTTVTGTGRANGVWYQVKLGSKTGWMSSQYLSKVSTAPVKKSPATPPVKKIAVAKYKTSIHLMLRSGAGTNHKIISSGKKGTTVTGTGRASGVWYQVKLGSKTGWMSSQYLSKVAATPAKKSPAPVKKTPAPVVVLPAQSAPTSTKSIQYKTTIHLMLRSGAGTNHKIIGSGVMGTIVTGTGRTNGIWYEVTLGSKTGWMSSDYLQAVTGPNSIAALQAYAGSKLGNAKQLSCLVTLWNRESNWNYKAINPAFSPSKPNLPQYQAYGIAQSAPGNKMATHGSDWVTNPRTQINWGLDYISGRYGTPCKALDHSYAKNWY